MSETVTILASSLHSAEGQAALALVDKLCGPSNEWGSPLIGYRLSADFQSDFKDR